MLIGLYRYCCTAMYSAAALHAHPVVSLPVSMAAPAPSVSCALAPSLHPATRRWVTGLEQGKDGSLTPKGQYYVDWSKQVSQLVILLHLPLQQWPHRAEG